MHKAAEVRAAYRELTHASTTMASLDVIATWPGRERGTRATLHAPESGSELASVVGEKAHTPGLTGPARALSIRAHNDVEAGLAAAPAGDTVWVSAADILARRTGRLPPPVRESLRTASAITAAASSTAGAAATVAQTNCQDATPAIQPTHRSNATTLARPPISSAQSLAP
ncbi:hypothetical protein KVF89_04830 [Nocardioides carbamazepini]|uniref:hypothetical protein n=1 Tax=Nocardioides carbamazepini TaxID=2854259 RepID=UPI00214A7582|nr:hypothetical protein [Nocardioides carbamazepini]MCR1781853.1 hypothetical protein [Nocardioides carbamazepini]